MDIVLGTPVSISKKKVRLNCQLTEDGELTISKVTKSILVF